MNIGVYGLGRFGMFWASELARVYPVKGFSRTPKDTLPFGVKFSDIRHLNECDLLFLCVSISSLKEVLEHISSLIRPGMIIADTCSVKIYPATLMQEMLPHNVEIIGTHPMFGPDSGKNGINGLPVVYAPIRVSSQNDKLIYELFTRLGLAIHCMSADEHDREAAKTQGITHFVGRVLEGLSLSPSPIGTNGYNRLLDIVEQTCNDPMQLFLDLQHYNPYTKKMRIELANALDSIMEQL